MMQKSDKSAFMFSHVHSFYKGASLQPQHATLPGVFDALWNAPTDLGSHICDFSAKAARYTQIGRLVSLSTLTLFIGLALIVAYIHSPLALPLLALAPSTLIYARLRLRRAISLLTAAAPRYAGSKMVA